MAVNPPRSAMPGTFDTHLPTNCVGRKSNIFQPPQTPSVSASSSLYLARSTTSLMSLDSDRSTMLSRKRTREDYGVYSHTTPANITPNWASEMDTDAMHQVGDMDPGSPVPFVNTRYQLSGGLDTPTAAAQYGEGSDFSDVGYRRNLNGAGVKRAFDDENRYSYFPRLPEPEASIPMDSNGRPRVQSPSQQQQRNGWSKTAFGVVGGVVGKVWEFCKAGAFRGFAAGGGARYDVDPAHPYIHSECDILEISITEKAAISQNSERSITPVPGHFPDEDYIPNYMDQSTAGDTPPRPAKRRQVSMEDGIGKSWVVVSNATPTKTSTIATTTPTSQSRPAARYSMATASSNGRRLLNNASASRPASRAVTRRPMSATSRISGVSHAGSPSLRYSQPASFASPRSPGGSKIPVPSNSPRKTVPNSLGSPVAKDALKWAAKKRQEEREADESIRRFNSQLKAMIREGKEALGTKIDVEITDGQVMEDEGFEDGDFQGVGKRWR